MVNRVGNVMSDGSASEWLTRKEASAFLCSIGCPVAPKSLCNMASNNNAMGGPPFTRVRFNMVRYERKDLRLWAERQTEKVI